jgi:nucleotide-binding universal stress UspA family protein
MMASANHPGYRRVLVQVDTSTHCRNMLDAAVDIAARLQAELHGLFIEDRDLVSTGGLDFVREFSLSSPSARAFDDKTLDSQLKALASSARRQLEHAGSRHNVSVVFRTVRGDFQQEMENAAVDADLIIIEGTGRLHTRHYSARLPGRALLRPAGRPTLLLKAGRPLAKQFIVICDSIDNARKCLGAALSLPGDTEREITLLPCAAKPGDSERIAAELEGLIVELELKAHVAAPTGLAAKIILARPLAPGSLLVVAAGGAVLGEEANAQTLFESPYPLLLVQ